METKETFEMNFECYHCNKPLSDQQGEDDECCKECYEKYLGSWNDDLSESDREALLEWYNMSDPDDKDRKLLADLCTSGGFQYWECPACTGWDPTCIASNREMIYVGNPDSWDNFQGVNQSEHLGELCSSCGSDYLRLKEFADD